MLKYFIYIHLFFSLCYVLNVFASDAEYESCVTHERKSGQCIVISLCPPLVNLLKKRPISEENQQRLKQANCGFDGLHPKVCCPLGKLNQPVLTSTPPKADKNYDYYYEDEPIDFTINRSLPSLDECGAVTEEEKILRSYPWTILLDYETPNSKEVHCGGALIHKRYVLTAAHCVVEENIPENWKLISIRVGEYDRNIAIEENYVHEGYDPSSDNRHHDIALLRLVHDVDFGDGIQPICLQPNSEFVKNISGVGDIGTIAGWGITKHSSGFKKKHQTKMEIKDNSVCESKYGFKEMSMDEGQFCATGNNACYGDSGGVLFYQNEDKHLEQTNFFAYGVQAIGLPQCSEEEYPVVYIKIENYVPWIVEKLKS